jgi:hypothetical protein
MKYAVLFDGEKASAETTDAERSRHREEYLALNDVPGIFEGEQLHPLAMSTTVDVEGGQTLLTDGRSSRPRSTWAGSICSRQTISTRRRRSRHGPRRADRGRGGGQADRAVVKDAAPLRMTLLGRWQRTVASGCLSSKTLLATIPRPIASGS